MNLVAVSQRVEVYETISERRDALDQRWNRLLDCAKLTPILLPNIDSCAKQLVEKLDIRGIILTGGNDLVAYGGHAPERDDLELWLINYAIQKKLPLLGVCRGMQMIQHHLGIALKRVSGHVKAKQVLNINGKSGVVNSFHHWGAYDTPDGYEVFAISDDKVVKGIKSSKGDITGIMWHPERIQPYREDDIHMLNDIFLT